MSVVVCLNFKGGVGKTTVCAHVARALAQFQRKHVLLIDLDPQFNLTQLLYKIDDIENLFGTGGRTAARLFEYGVGGIPDAPHAQHHAPAPNSMIETLYQSPGGGRGKLDFVSGSIDLIRFGLWRDRATIETSKRMFSEFLKFCQTYDVILIDLNPGVSELTYSALQRADHILCPVREERYSHQGIKFMGAFVKEHFPEKLAADNFFGVVMNLSDNFDQPGSTLVETQIQRLEAFSKSVLPVRIPEHFLLRKKFNSKAGLFFDQYVPIYSIPKKSALTDVFRNLSREVVSFFRF